MVDRLTEIADKIDELLYEYETIIKKDMQKNNDPNTRVLALLATYIPNERTWIKLIR